MGFLDNAAEPARARPPAVFRPVLILSVLYSYELMNDFISP
jgi:hypothetical protein